MAQLLNVNELLSDFTNLNQAVIFDLAAEQATIDTSFSADSAQNYLAKAKQYAGKSEYLKAAENFIRALNIYEILNDNTEIANVHNNLGVLHYNQGDYKTALKYLKKSLMYSDSQNDELLHAKNFNNIGLIYTAQKDYKQALGFHLKSLALYQKMALPSGIANAYNNIGRIHYLQKELSTAHENYQRSLKIHRQNKDITGQAIVYINLGVACAEAKSYDEALNFYKRSLACYTKLGNKKGIATNLVNIAFVCKEVGQLDKAIQIAKKGLVITQQLDYTEGSLFAAETITQALKQQADYKQAFEFLELSKTIQKKHFDENRQKNINELKIRFEIEQKEKAFQLQKVLLQEQQKDNKALKKLNQQIVAQQMDLQTQAAKFETLNENLKQFTSVAAHDLREPLRMISSFSALLKRRYQNELDEDGQCFIDFIEDAAQRMHTLLSDLVNYMRSGLDNQPITTVDLNDVVAATQSTLALKIKESKALFEVGELPIITAHFTPIFQVFQALIDNALKFSHSTTCPTIRIEAETFENDYQINITDQGIGVEEAYLEKVFDVFTRLHPQNQYVGSGMGLAISKKIIEQYGGKIWAIANPNDDGLRISFTLPK
ncbi:MAG: tetratricopeptide repeat protein [Chitinophagales bacterium]